MYHAAMSADSIADYCRRFPNRGGLSILTTYKMLRGQFAEMVRLRREGLIASWFLDTGTFGDNPGGSNPGLIDNYGPFLDIVMRVGHEFDWIAAFDRDFGFPSENQFLYREMLKRLEGRRDTRGRLQSDKLIPTVHDREHAFAEFEEFVADGAKLIAIGSRPKLPDDQWESIMQFRTERQTPIHVFGNFTLSQLMERRVESVDSSTFAVTRKYGLNMMLWDANLHAITKIDLRKKALTPEQRQFIGDTFGMTTRDLRIKATNMWIVNTFAIQQMQDYLNSINSGLVIF